MRARRWTMIIAAALAFLVAFLASLRSAPAQDMPELTASHEIRVGLK